MLSRSHSMVVRNWPRNLWNTKRLFDDNIASLSTGTISVDRRATLEPRMYNISVLGVDKGAPSKSTAVLVSVTVTDVNEKAPYFPDGRYTAIITENNNASKPVVTYPAKDPDKNANLVYSIIKDQMVFKFGTEQLERSKYQVSQYKCRNQ